MSFCINCGRELAEGEKFCANCGKSVNDSNSSSQRKITYEGEVHKCPQCGEVLDSFITVCPSCGYELRGSSATSAVKEFATKLNSLCYLKIVLPVSSKLPQISLCNSKTDFLENKMFYFSDITGFSEDAVKCHAQIMSQNFVLQPGA